MDESFLECDSGTGYYIVAAAVVDDLQAQKVARDVMVGLLGRSTREKLHWNEMDRARQLRAAAAVAGIDGYHVVAVAPPYRADAKTGLGRAAWNASWSNSPAWASPPSSRRAGRPRSTAATSRL
jgi:hypothetical protein